MTHLSHAPALSPVSLSGAVETVDATAIRNIRRLTLFQLDDAVRDARGGDTIVVWVAKKHTPLPALARYRAEHPDMTFDVEEDKTRFRVSIALARKTLVQ